MPTSKISVTLYTLRDFVKTPAEISETLKRVKSIGYKNIQLSALGVINPRDLAEMIHDNKLNVCATHVPFERLTTELDNVIAEHSLWNCKHIAVGSMPKSYWDHPDGFKHFAFDASEIALKLKASGITFSYHNHHMELVRIGNQTGLSILIDESDPALCFEIDTYWIQYGGGDPIYWIDRVKNRCPIIHFKDMAVLGREQIMAEVGSGNLNWQGIVSACERSAAQWYVVEQDTCQGDPFDSITISYHNMLEMGL
mgnify:CR=1 FL=1